MSIVNPKIKEYLKFKGRLDTGVIFKELGITPHEGQQKLIEAYDKKIAPSQETINRGELIGCPLSFEYAYDTLVVAAGRRGGKSYSLSAISTGELLIPYSHVMLASYTLENCDIIFKQVREFIVKLGVEISVDRRKDRELELINGARLTVGSVENIESKLGNYVTLLLLDEAKKFQKSLYEQVLIPMLADASPMARAVLISSPEQGWFESYYNYSQSNDPKYAKYWGINFPTMSNPAIPRSWIEQQRATLPPDVFEQEIEGKFTSAAGRVFPEFTKERNVRSADYYPYLWDWIRNGNTTVNSIDSGYNHYFSSIHYVYVEEIDTYIVFNEYNKNKTVTKIHAENIKNYEEENEFESELRYADPAAAQQIADLAEYDLFYNKSTKNLRETIQTCNALFFQNSEITGESRLIILDNCYELIRQLLEIMWKEGQDKQTYEKSSAGTKPFQPDRNQKTDWDLIDAMRYGIHSFHMGQAANISLMDLDESNDYEDDKFYQQMHELGYIKN